MAKTSPKQTQNQHQLIFRVGLHVASTPCLVSDGCGVQLQDHWESSKQAMGIPKAIMCFMVFKWFLMGQKGFPWIFMVKSKEDILLFPLKILNNNDKQWLKKLLLIVNCEPFWGIGHNPGGLPKDLEFLFFGICRCCFLDFRLNLGVFSRFPLGRSH